MSDKKTKRNPYQRRHIPRTSLVDMIVGPILAFLDLILGTSDEERRQYRFSRRLPRPSVEEMLMTRASEKILANRRREVQEALDEDWRKIQEDHDRVTRNEWPLPPNEQDDDV